MQTLAQIKSLLDERGLRPKRSLGQNFLIDHNLIRKLVDAAAVRAGDLVLEVGPGTGALTEELLARRCRVVACELDDALADLLRERIPALPGGENFTLIHRDCLDGKHALAPELLAALRSSAAQPAPFSLVANLPYGAATPLISTLLLHHPECATLAVTIQREVADRLLAAPSTRDYGALAVIAQTIGRVERIASLPPQCFWPRPDVTSSMVLLRRREDPPIPPGHFPALSELCRTLFAQRRKQLCSLLGRQADWPAIARAPGCDGIIPTLRAEQLSPDQIIALGRALGALPATAN